MQMCMPFASSFAKHPACCAPSVKRAFGDAATNFFFNSSFRCTCPTRWHWCPSTCKHSEYVASLPDATRIMHADHARWLGIVKQIADDRFDECKAQSPFCKARRSTAQGVGDHQSGKLPCEPTELRRLAQTDSSVASRPDARHDSACSHSASSGVFDPESVKCCVLPGGSWQQC